MSKSEDNELRARSLESDAKSHTAAAARYGRCTDLAERRLDAARECLEKATELRQTAMSDHRAEGKPDA